MNLNTKKCINCLILWLRWQQYKHRSACISNEWAMELAIRFEKHITAWIESRKEWPLYALCIPHAFVIPNDWTDLICTRNEALIRGDIIGLLVWQMNAWVTVDACTYECVISQREHSAEVIHAFGQLNRISSEHVRIVHGSECMMVFAIAEYAAWYWLLILGIWRMHKVEDCHSDDGDDWANPNSHIEETKSAW